MTTKIEGASRGNMFCIDPSKIVPGHRMRRFEPTEHDVLKLAADIMAHGQQQPVVCRRDGERIVLVAGETRRQAAFRIRAGFDWPDESGEIKRLHDQEFLLKFTLASCNDTEARELAISENNQRNATTDIDDAHNQNWLRESRGWTETQIARFYGWISNGKPQVNRVTRLRKLLFLSEEIQRKIHDGEMPTEAGVQLAELPEAERAPMLAELGVKVRAAAVKAKVREWNLAAVEQPEPAAEEQPSETPSAVEEPAAPRAVSRSMKEVRQFFVGLAEGEDKKAAEFAKDALLWLSGRKGDKAMANAIKRLSA